MKTILLIDSDLIARRAIAKILQEKTEYQLIVNGETNNAVESIVEYNPDLLLLGIKPNEVEEIALLSLIKIRFPDLPVVILTERSEPGAAIAVAALRLGVIDFITKPEDCNTMLFAERHLAKRLLPITKFSLRLKKRNRTGSSVSPGLAKENQLSTTLWPLNLIVIGGCTGGPVALFKLVESLPKDFSVPIVVAQHLPKYFTKVLAARLNEVTELSVREAKNGVLVKPGSIWIAPGGYHCEVSRYGNETQLKVHRGPRENGARPSIDMLFRSAGRLYGPGVLGVILSGCGKDGLAGASTIRESGGHILVQDYRTALAPDLPLAMMREGQYDIVSPVDKMAEHFSMRDQGVVHSEAESRAKNEEVLTVKQVSYRHIDQHLFSTLN